MSTQMLWILNEVVANGLVLLMFYILLYIFVDKMNFIIIVSYWDFTLIKIICTKRIVHIPLQR